MRGIRAQAFQTAFLQHAQQLGLLGQGQVANFVEENGLAPGLFEAPRRNWMAPVKAPFSWPKSSSSIKDSGKAQAEKATNGCFARGPRS